MISRLSLFLPISCPFARHLGRPVEVIVIAIAGKWFTRFEGVLLGLSLGSLLSLKRKEREKHGEQRTQRESCLRLFQGKKLNKRREKKLRWTWLPSLGFSHQQKDSDPIRFLIGSTILLFHSHPIAILCFCRSTALTEYLIDKAVDWKGNKFKSIQSGTYLSDPVRMSVW